MSETWFRGPGQLRKRNNQQLSLGNSHWEGNSRPHSCLCLPRTGCSCPSWHLACILDLSQSCSLRMNKGAFFLKPKFFSLSSISSPHIFYMITFINQMELPLFHLLKYQLDMPMISQLACHFFDIPR